MDGWVNKMRRERKDILTHATTWMNPEDIVVTERSQSQRDESVCSRLQEAPGVVESVGTESRVVVARAWEQRARVGCCSVGVGFSFT